MLTATRASSTSSDGASCAGSTFREESPVRPARASSCQRDAGYFISATTLQRQDAQGEGCVASRFIDAEQVPFFVLPDDLFGNAHVGDIVVARLDGSPNGPIYGIIGDTGPVWNLGEGSIAFNRALLGKSRPIASRHDVMPLDIAGKAVTVLVLGGTRDGLEGNYSRRNIEEIGRREFARWSGHPNASTRRLNACMKLIAP